MTKVVIVGEIYNAGLEIGGGPILPGAPQPPLGVWGPTDPRPTHPIAGYPWRPPGVPTHPIYNPPYPDQGLPGGQPYPDQGLPGSQPYPDQGLPGAQPRPDHGLPPFASHPWVPPQTPVVDPIDPNKGYLVAYVPSASGGIERITFTIDLSQLPEPVPPTEPEPKA